MPSLREGDARRVATQVLRALGAAPDAAEKVAGWLVNSDLSGHPSHGIIRLIDYAARTRKGDLVPTGRPEVVRGAQGGPVVLVDGGAGFGHLAAEALVGHLIDRATESGVAVGGIVNASHTGRLGEWAELAIDGGVVLFMCSASLARGNVAAFGAREPRLGTNPMTVGVPGADAADGFVLDYATSAISGGKIDYLVQAGLEAPADSLLDAAGNPTADPAAWKQGGMLLPFGGHKGYGLSLLIGLLAGCVVGSAAPDNARHGVFAFAVSLSAFAEPDTVREAVSRQVARMRDTPPRDGVPAVEIPGDYERRNRAGAAGSIEVPEATWQQILAVAGSLGLDPAALAPAAG
jgi:LDH2 family malate/lactate/ureidoglycolate dehydrogenase